MHDSPPAPHEAAPTPAADAGPVTVVGVGASAGGLDAFSELLRHLPASADLALVLVQHLAPDHESSLPKLLAQTTALPVEAAEDGRAIAAGHVYVIPPGRLIALDDAGHLRLTDAPHRGAHAMPVDVFFRSLAHHAGDRAVGVVLSGTGSDGTEGLREIKSVGGFTLVQDPETASYDGMPRSAIGRGVADLVLPPADLAARLGALPRHPYTRGEPPSAEGGALAASPEDEREIAHLLDRLRAATGIEYDQYKAGTIERRIQRRMALHHLESLAAYRRRVEQDPDERDALARDLLIHVTRFFRHPATFERLGERVFPELLRQRAEGEPIRIWVPGCASGEEAYAVAIALLDHLGRDADAVPVQIFATDVSEEALATARTGVYPESIAADVSSDRLGRYFGRTNGSLRIAKRVRDLCVFARHDVTRDPPFSRLDLIVCRNLLIYLGAPLQKRVLGLFHYALKPARFLVLGEAESTGQAPPLFAAVDKKTGIHVRRDVETPHEAPVVHAAAAAAPRAAAAAPAPAAQRQPVQREADRRLLERYGPAGVVVDDALQIVEFRGATGRYLEPAPGDASLNLLKMAREGLLPALRSAIHEARGTGGELRREAGQVRAGGDLRRVEIVVLPLEPAGAGRHFLVLFEEPAEAPATAAGDGETESASAPESQRVQELERELAQTRGHLETMIRDLESANEQLQSANEELQSTNEELDTAKEELQSTNEELNTVNEELQARNDELERVNADLENLLANAPVAVVILDRGLRIRRYTPAAADALNLIPGDVGREIGDIRANLEIDRLDIPASEALEGSTIVERETRDAAGRYCVLRVRPCIDAHDRIDGAVLTLFDVDATKRRQHAVEAARDFAEAVVETVRQPLVVLDDELRVRMLNRAFRDTFGGDADTARGAYFSELNGGEWDVPELRRLLDEVLPSDRRFEAYELERDLPGRGRRRFLLNGRRLDVDADGEAKILLAMEEVTDLG